MNWLEIRLLRSRQGATVYEIFQIKFFAGSEEGMVGADRNVVGPYSNHCKIQNRLAEVLS